MCGLYGTTEQGSEADKRVWRGVQLISHRGPDGQGIQTHHGVTHGHARLALVDLTAASQQPFKGSGSCLSFNGEIWNYVELREHLKIVHGIECTTTGDTEVLCRLLDAEGIDCLSRLDGMFAFAYSSEVHGNWLVRDSFGKVPLYFVYIKGRYTWCSERKGFDSDMRPMAVPPGMAIDMCRRKIHSWYKLPPGTADPLTPEAVLDFLRLGVEKRITADVPVCCLISGGLDSGIILALAKELRPDVVAYTAVFDPVSEDAKSARRLCEELGVELRPVLVGTVYDHTIARAISDIEIPSKAQVEIAMLCRPLAKRIYADGFRACLSGEAADELFGGYGNFCIKASKANPAEVLALRRAQLQKMARGNFVRCNKAFMAHGVECRLPFMEQGLVEQAVRQSKADSPLGKKLLKQAGDLILPTWVSKRKKDTFQGGSGLSTSVLGEYPAPTRYYNAEAKRLFGYLPKD